MKMKKPTDKKLLNKILLTALAVSIFIILLILIINGIRTSHAQLLYSEMAGERWQGGDIPYSEVSVFYARDNSINENDIKGIRTKINKKLYEDSYLTEDSEKRAWIDSYCGQTVKTLRKDQSTLEVNVYAVGGDFFLIHPIPLAAGSYPDLTSPDVNQILLDEYTAWNLFGGNNLAGMKIWIDDSVFTITGVVRVEDRKEVQQAYGNRNAVYIPINAFNKNTEQDKETGEVLANCYEAVVPNSIKNYALNTVAEAVGIQFETDEEKKEKRSVLDFDGIEIVENTGRYDVSSLYNRMKNQKYSDMKTNDIVYPYWENVARYEESREIGTIRSMLVMMIIPLITFVAGIVWLIRRRRIALIPFILLKDKIETVIESRKEKNYEKRIEAEKAEKNGSSKETETDKMDAPGKV